MHVSCYILINHPRPKFIKYSALNRNAMCHTIALFLSFSLLSKQGDIEEIIFFGSRGRHFPREYDIRVRHVSLIRPSLARSNHRLKLL